MLQQPSSQNEAVALENKIETEKLVDLGGYRTRHYRQLSYLAVEVDYWYLVYLKLKWFHFPQGDDWNWRAGVFDTASEFLLPRGEIKS